jgi:hypothetical protein
MHTNCLFTLRHAACAPVLTLESVRAEALGADLYRISATVANAGFLPTHLTQRALDHRTAGSVSASIGLPAAAQRIMGSTVQQIGHLAGRDERRATWSPWMRDWHAARKPVEWLVRAPAGTMVTLQATAQKAGTVSAEVELP